MGLIAQLARPDGPVLDAANVIPAEMEADLDARLRDVLDNTQTEFVVVTVHSLDGQDVGAYANSLARTWSVGSTNGGVVLLVAPNDQQVRIETDDTVRMRLSDERCAGIIQHDLLPRFKSGDFSGGIAEGVEAIAYHL